MNPATPASVSASGENASADTPDYVLKLKRAASYLPATQWDVLRRAWEVGAHAHAGQMRKSGEPYITHPVAVACILADLGLDVEALVAAVLHDTIEDTALTRQHVTQLFGSTVADLVDGVTKLDKLKFRDREEAAAESFRKMLLAMSRDLRVIMIKLADRLHNMRTLGAQSMTARRRIALETLDIYAPIAHRLGMEVIKSELQNLSFAALYPWRHAIIEKHIQRQPTARRQAMAQVEVQLSQRLAREGVEHRLLSRIKTPWSIYNKMRQEGKSLDQVLDVFGWRLIVRGGSDCYRALGAVHAAFKPLDGRFRDFIAIPKANGYQSLHTVLFGPYGSPIEVQIRSEEMNMIAERGVAAHWTYKSGVGQAPNSAQSRAHAWIVDLVDSQRSAGSSLEFLDNVKIDLFPDEVYLFTPKGRILALPRQATALDFAYAVHTDVGNHAVATRVDKKLVPLRTCLSSGQTVEIITAPSAAPQPQWLEFVVSGKARTAIRHQLKQLEHEEAVQLGHRMLDRALESLDSSIERLPAGWLEGFLSEHRYPRLEAFLADIALGRWMPGQAAQALLHHGQVPVDENMQRPQEKLLIDGSQRGVIRFAQCCQPIPGDDIIGYHTSGKGIVVHRMNCPNLAELRKSPERWLHMGWDSQVTGDYDSTLIVEVENSAGILAQLAAAIGRSHSNIERVDYLERDANACVLRFNIQVRDRTHLAAVMRRLRRLQAVQAVRRQ